MNVIIIFGVVHDNIIVIAVIVVVNIIELNLNIIITNNTIIIIPSSSSSPPPPPAKRSHATREKLPVPPLTATRTRFLRGCGDWGFGVEE